MGEITDGSTCNESKQGERNVKRKEEILVKTKRRKRRRKKRRKGRMKREGRQAGRI